jgi:hypothetical protein
VGELVASGTCDHRGCDPRRSHRTRHDCAAPAAAGCKIRWSARACRAWAAYGGPSAPRVAKYARPAWVDCPARLAQQFSDPAIAIAAVLPSKLDNIGGETLLVLTTARILRCFERRCPSAAQARRSETCSCARTCSMQARRRAGLRSFPRRPPAE